MRSPGVLTAGPILVSAASLLLLSFSGPVPAGEDEVLLRFEQQEADQLIFHFWLPVDQVKDLYPDPIQPAKPKSTPGVPAAPEGMVDCYLVLGEGSYSFLLEGQAVEEPRMLHGYLLLAADVPPELNPGNADTTAVLAEYYCGNESLLSLLRKTGVPAVGISGSFESTLRADSQQMIQGSVNPAGYGEWRFRLVTRDLRHFDTGHSVLRAYFTAGKELYALDVQESDDFYMRAAGDIVFDGGTPLDGWQDRLMADRDHARYKYGTGNVHTIRRIQVRRAAR